MPHIVWRKYLVGNVEIAFAPDLFIKATNNGFLAFNSHIRSILARWGISSSTLHFNKWSESGSGRGGLCWIKTTPAAPVKERGHFLEARSHPSLERRGMRHDSDSFIAPTGRVFTARPL